MLMRCLKEYGGNDIFHLFALRFTKQLSLGNKINYAPTAVDRSQSGQKLSKHMYSLIWNSSESILSLAHKAMNYFSMIDNIHRSSEVACVQTSPISFDRDVSSLL